MTGDWPFQSMPWPTFTMWPGEQEMGEIRYPTLKIFSKEESMTTRTREDIRSIATEALISVATDTGLEPHHRVSAAMCLLDRLKDLSSRTEPATGLDQLTE